MVSSLLFSPHIILLLFKYSTLCSLCQSFRNRTESASNSPSRKGGVLLRSAFSRGATKGVGGQSTHLFSGNFRPEKTYRRKRNKPLQSDDFSSFRLSVREKFLKWCQTRLEVDFWTLQRKVRLLGLLQFHFLYKMEFHF